MNRMLFTKVAFLGVAIIGFAGCESTTVGTRDERKSVPRMVVKDARTVLAGAPKDWSAWNIGEDYGWSDVIGISDENGKAAVYVGSGTHNHRTNDGNSLPEISKIMRNVRMNPRTTSGREVRDFCEVITALHSEDVSLILFRGAVDPDTMLAYTNGNSRLAKRLNTFASQSSFRFQNGRLSARFHALTKSGAIDRWEITGELNQNSVSLKSVVRTRIAPPGTYVWAVIGK